MTAGPLPSLTRWAESAPWEDEAASPGRSSGPAPSNARMYDYLLGGKDNYASDRDLTEWALRRCPVVGRLVQANRGFLDHAAALLAEDAGLRQFVDIGCGLPVSGGAGDVGGVGGVGAVVRRADPSCRVAYVDNDPMVVVHARARLAVDGRTGAFEGDVRDPAALLADPGLRALIDLSEPVGVLLGCVLDITLDEHDPRGIVRALVDLLPPGSHVVVTHAERTPELEAIAGLPQNPDLPFCPRSLEAVTEICGSLEMIPPYPARLPLPHAVHTTGPVPLIGCIGRVPG
ncbi:SAM-dependent methyltransferase [Actinomadura sp. GC306]|uniref:SAM-dependent methyltransferase n=1 Tax=Actinomadura sp. GC306 TaxID=2530367 RepID=UPI0014050704|nr:SAM-dependent methyltransferase [Actinomadura sp. GC306]